MPYFVCLTAGSGGGPPSPLDEAMSDSNFKVPSKSRCPIYISRHVKIWGTRDLFPRATQFPDSTKNTGHAFFSSSIFFYGLRLWSWVVIIFSENIPISGVYKLLPDPHFGPVSLIRFDTIGARISNRGRKTLSPTNIKSTS